MDRLDLMRTFVSVLDSGSFTAAAERHGADPKLVSKHVAQLEATLGVRLFNRTTRTLSPTEAGRRLYEGAVELLSRHEELESSLRAEGAAVAGLVRLSAPVTYGDICLVPQLRRFMIGNPQLRIDLRLSDRFVDLAEDGFDLALRIGGEEQSALIGRRLGAVELFVVASPGLIERMGTPATPEEITRWPAVGDSNLRGGAVWPLSGAQGTIRVPISPRFTVNSARVAAELALAGEGLALCPDHAVASALEDGRLVRILPQYCGPRLDVRAVFLNARMPMRVRHLVDFLAQDQHATPKC